MKNRFVATVCFFMFLVSPAFAEEESNLRSFEQYPEALGVFFGEVGGMGLSYHQWLPELPGSGIQVAAGILYAPAGETGFSWGSFLDYTVGVEYQRSIYGEDFTNWIGGQLYLWGGLSHRGLIEQVTLTEGDWSADPPVEATYGPGPYTPTVTIGVGIGVEIIVFRHFSFPIEVGYSATYNLIASSFTDGLTISLIPQGGARYRY